MNEQIETIFKGFTVDGVEIPVYFVYYFGHGEPYIVYSETNKDTVYSCENGISNYVSYYDFDIYSKANFLKIKEEVHKILVANGWTWQPDLESSDMYETDTGYFHKTACYAIERSVNNG